MTNYLEPTQPIEENSTALAAIAKTIIDTFKQLAVRIVTLSRRLTELEHT